MESGASAFGRKCIPLQKITLAMKQKYLIGQFIILLAMLLGGTMRIHAQAVKCDIAGKVMDENQLPVAYASVALYNEKMPIAGVITDDEGRFVLKTAQTDKEYRLAIEFVGYDKYEKMLAPNSPRIQLGTIVLKESAISLGEVVVSAKEVAHKPTIEHTTINASANMASGKGSAIDILRSSSSVSISNDVISVRGNSPRTNASISRISSASRFGQQTRATGAAYFFSSSCASE